MSTKYPSLPRFGGKQQAAGYGRVITKKSDDDDDDTLIEEKAPPRTTKALAKGLMNMFQPADQKLMRICKETGDVKALASLLQRKKLDVNRPDEIGDTPLHEACFNGHCEAVKYLVETAGASVNVQTTGGHTPLHLACINGHRNILEYLHKRCRADLSVTTRDGATPLHWSAMNGRFDCVRYLMEHGNVDGLAVTGEGFTALHLACSMGQLKIAKYLIIDAGVPVDCVNGDEDTPLHYACFEGAEVTVRFLVEEAGASVTAVDKAMYTPLHIAAARGHLGIVSYLTTYVGVNLRALDKAGASALHLTCVNGHLECAKQIYSKAPDLLTLRDLSQRSVLHDAAHGNHLALVEYLVTELHAEVDAVNTGGFTPLLLAAAKGNLDVLVFLVERGGANKWKFNQNNNNCLHIACVIGHIKIAQYMIRGNLDPNVPNKDGHRPLQLACAHGHLEIVQLIMQLGVVDKNALDEAGDAPLVAACRAGHVVVAKYLIVNEKVDCNARDKKLGRNGLHLGCVHGHKELVAYLAMETSIDLFASDNEGHKAFEIATSPELAEIVRQAITRSAENASRRLKGVRSGNRVDAAQRVAVQRMNRGQRSVSVSAAMPPPLSAISTGEEEKTFPDESSVEEVSAVATDISDGQPSSEANIEPSAYPCDTPVSNEAAASVSSEYDNDDNCFNEFVSAGEHTSRSLGEQATMTSPRNSQHDEMNGKPRYTDAQSLPSSFTKSPKMVRIQPPPGSTPLLKFDDF